MACLSGQFDLAIAPGFCPEGRLMGCRTRGRGRGEVLVLDLLNQCESGWTIFLISSTHTVWCCIWDMSFSSNTELLFVCLYLVSSNNYPPITISSENWFLNQMSAEASSNCGEVTVIDLNPRFQSSWELKLSTLPVNFSGSTPSKCPLVFCAPSRDVPVVPVYL